MNTKQIRKITHNGREHWVLPSYTLPANVIMNGGLYPAAEIDAHYQGLEGTLAPLGHPVVDGQFVSAFSPEGINVGHVGAFNRNVKKAGNRVYLEKWLDVEVAQRSEAGRELIERVEALERGEDVPPIHTSVAVFLEQLEASSEQRKAGAEWVAKINAMDHDAILLHDVGAATPEQGVGLMVNADKAVPLAPNKGALAGETYREKEARLDRAVRVRFDGSGAWVADFTEAQVIVVTDRDGPMRFDYSDENGEISLSDAGTPVERETSWVAVIANSLKKIFKPHQARPDSSQKEGDMPLTPEEKAELTNDISKAVIANVGQAVAEAIKPVSDAVTTLQENHKALSDSLTANQRAEEEAKREAVAAKFGKEVAEKLAGNALDALYKQCGDAGTLGPGQLQPNAYQGAPDPITHFGGAK